MVHELAELFERQQLGRVMWISARGTSMRPVLRGGDVIRALRCAEEDLAPGDIAILRRSDGLLVAHLVVGASPLRTTAFLGVRDEVRLRGLGRATAIRRGGRVLPLPKLSRAPLLMLHHFLSTVRTSPWMRPLWQVAFSWTGGARRWFFGAVVVRELHPGDLPALAEYVPAGMAQTFTQLSQWLHPPRMAVGALAGRRLMALALLAEEDSQPTIVHLSTALVARGTGLDAEVLACVVERVAPRHARLGADAGSLVAPYGFRTEGAPGRDGRQHYVR